MRGCDGGCPLSRSPRCNQRCPVHPPVTKPRGVSLRYRGAVLCGGWRGERGEPAASPPLTPTHGVRLPARTSASPQAPQHHPEPASPALPLLRTHPSGLPRSGPGLRTRFPPSPAAGRGTDGAGDGQRLCPARAVTHGTHHPPVPQFPCGEMAKASPGPAREGDAGSSLGTFCRHSRMEKCPGSLHAWPGQPLPQPPHPIPALVPAPGCGAGNGVVAMGTMGPGRELGAGAGTHTFGSGVSAARCGVAVLALGPVGPARTPRGSLLLLSELGS